MKFFEKISILQNRNTSEEDQNLLMSVSRGISILEFSSVQLISHVWLFVTPWTAPCQASLSFTKFWSLLKLLSIESVIRPLVISSCVISFSSLLQSFPASGSFPMSQFFISGGQSIGVSAAASVLPMNSGLISFRLTGWISLQSKGLSRVFSNTTVHLRLIEAAAWIRIYFSVKFIKMHPLFCLFATLHGIWHLPNQGSNLFLLQWKLGISMRPSFWFC